jgi:hypothetical protein
MKRTLMTSALLGLLLPAFVAGTQTDDKGWIQLFNGKDLTGWRNYKKKDVSKGWKVIDGALCRVDQTAGDIVTLEQYDNFVLELDYKVPEHANSGIMYRVSETKNSPWQTGIEFQILDNTDPKGDDQKSGWAYQLYKPALDERTGKPFDATKPVNQWNHIKLVCDGPHVEHWMNDVKYCAFDIGSDDWKQHLAKSKFAKMQGFATNTKGYIALQGDHGNVCFKDIKIRVLPAKK